MKVLARMPAVDQPVEEITLSHLSAASPPRPAGVSWISGLLRRNLSRYPWPEIFQIGRLSLLKQAAATDCPSIRRLEIFDPMVEETGSKKECGGKKKAMLAYGVIQISATGVGDLKPPLLWAFARSSKRAKPSTAAWMR